jgi:hypothetical protein
VIIYLLQTSLVECIREHPLAAATTLRRNGLEALFRDIIADTHEVPAAQTVVVTATAADTFSVPATEELLKPEDSGQAHIIGMSHHPAVGVSNLPSWCKCGRCRHVDNKKARICCRKTIGRCVLLIDQELCSIVLGTRNVRTALNQARCLRHQDIWDYEAPNLRFQAYQQYIYATIGTTGRGNRVVIPACVCWGIRDRWPSLTYVGFKESAVNGAAALAAPVLQESDEEEHSD